MKKKICFIFSLFLIFIFSLSPVYASSVELYDMTIHATIREDGSAYIQEVWQMDVNEGTEVYKVFNNMGESRISQLRVKDDLGNQYRYIGNWDVDASKEEKDGKCGMVTNDDNYELCFGIGEYGERIYTFEYEISNFVKQYTNDQGINYAFFSEMELEPQRAQITLSSPYPFTEDNSKIWAFGYYGDVQFVDGKVVMNTAEAVPSGGKMQLLMRINKGTFQNAYSKNMDFDDILSDAKKGSSYEDSEYNYGDGYYSSFVYNDNSLAGIMIAVGAIVTALVIGAIGYGVAAGKREKFIFTDRQPLKDTKDIMMFRDIPCDKNIYLFYYLSRKLGLATDTHKGGLIAAILLRWIQKGYIHFEKREEKGMFSKKDGYKMEFQSEIPYQYHFEKMILGYFKEAAGSNGLLETKEFEKWCKNNYETFEEWFDSVETELTMQLQDRKLMSIEKTYTKFIGINIPHATDCYDVTIRDEMEHIIGLKKFLKEMSLIDEKEVIEVKMWEEYLIYASILGIADKVEQQLGRLCPTFNQQSDLDTIYTMHMIHMFSYNSVRASHNAAEAAASSGLGGGASFGGGGGGFSGGGGGGVR